MDSEIALRGVHGKYLSATPDGRLLWSYDVAHLGEYFRVEQRQNGKIALMSAFDMYVSAQPDGRVECNRREAPPGGWEEFTVEYRSDYVVCLKSCHGKYLSAQKVGPEWWDWTVRQEADAQDIQIEPYRTTGEAVLSEPILNSDQKYVFAPEHKGWHWHNERARGMGGHIASITSAKENEDITRISGGAPVWLGGIRKGDRYRGKPLAVADRKPGDPGEVGPGPEDWYWSDGRPWSYTNWGPGEPNNWDSSENRVQHLGKFDAVWNDVGEHWEGPAVYRVPIDTWLPSIMPTDNQLPSITVSGAGSREVNGTYVFKEGEHENRHWGTISGHYQHTNNPEIFIAFQDCGATHGRPEWNKWMVISKIGVLYAAHTGGKIGVPPRDGEWETVDSWGNPGAPGGKHPAPAVRHGQHPGTPSRENFEFIPVSEYDEVWNDRGSGANQDVSVWRVRVPHGCHLIGMTAKNGHSPPTHPTLVIRADGSQVAPPERFDLVWWQERGRRRFWCWRPIPPPGYVSLGDVGTVSETPPSRKDVVCVSSGCLSPSRQPLGSQIWNDRGGGAPRDAAFFEQPGGTGLFRCSDDGTHNKPHGEFPIPAHSPAGAPMAQSTNGVDVLEAVVGKPVRFKINKLPSSNDAWVGIYPSSASDQDHGPENKRWKWLRNIDVNNASFPKQGVGDWSIRVFSDGGYKLHERKDFVVRSGKPEPLDLDAVLPSRRSAWITLAIGAILFSIGLPLFIGGQGPAGVENLGMIIPGAILFGVGALLAVVATLILISSWSKSYAETGKPAPGWTKIASVLAGFLLIPGIALVIVGIISMGTIHHEEVSSARLLIADADGMGDQGFIIFIEAVPGDLDSNGIHDYCEMVTVNATHSGLWMSDPWTSHSKQNEADQTRQVFEFEIAHGGSGCDANVWPQQKAGNLVKLGRACYGCMGGYTEISASESDAPYPIPMWIQDGEKVLEAAGVWIGGSILSGFSILSLTGLSIFRRTIKGRNASVRKGPMTPSIEVEEARVGESIRFRIKNPPNDKSAWVGIYPLHAQDKDHGEEGVGWIWLRDLRSNRASFPERSEGRWSIRVFQDGGYTTVCNLEFDVLPKKERWWED